MTGEIAYELEEVVTTADTATEPAALGMEGAVARLATLAAADGSEWRVRSGRGRRGRGMRYLIPADLGVLQRSPLLPEPIWSEDLSFARPEALEALADLLADLPAPQEVATVASFDWGLQRTDLVRYNRVEGLSVGAHAAVRFGLGGAPVSAVLTARIGHADLEPRGTLALTHETLTRSATLSAYRELQLVEPATRALGLGPSLAAFVLGRDDGDYYQATGVALGVTPPVADRPWYRARVYGERQEPVARETDASLPEWIGWDDGFRPVPPAARADQAGVELHLAPWWGRDPLRPGVGLELALQAERGDFDFERVRAGARAALPAGARLALGARAGTTRGDAPPQRLWVLGGPVSLRGYAPGVATGRTFVSGRGEVVVPLSGLPAARAVGLAFFVDGGWAGQRDAIL